MLYDYFFHNKLLYFYGLQVTISLKKEDEDPEKSQYTEYFYAGGLTEYVSWLNTDKVRMYTLKSCFIGVWSLSDSLLK